jgi:hypothetical protein
MIVIMHNLVTISHFESSYYYPFSINIVNHGFYTRSKSRYVMPKSECERTNNKTWSDIDVEATFSKLRKVLLKYISR